MLPSALLNPPDHQSQQTKWHPISSRSPKLQQTTRLSDVKYTVHDGWHQARQNFATEPRPQAISPGEVVSALGRMKLGTDQDMLCPPKVPKTSGSQSRLADLFTKMTWEQRIRKIWRQAKTIALANLAKIPHLAASYRPISLQSICYKLLEPSCRESPQLWKTFSVSIRLASAVAAAPATKSQPSQRSLRMVQEDIEDWCSLSGPKCCIRHYMAQWLPMLSNGATPSLHCKEATDTMLQVSEARPNWPVYADV